MYSLPVFNEALAATDAIAIARNINISLHYIDSSAYFWPRFGQLLALFFHFPNTFPACFNFAGRLWPTKMFGSNILLSCMMSTTRPDAVG